MRTCKTDAKVHADNETVNDVKRDGPKEWDCIAGKMATLDAERLGSMRVRRTQRQDDNEGNGEWRQERWTKGAGVSSDDSVGWLMRRP